MHLLNPARWADRSVDHLHKYERGHFDEGELNPEVACTAKTEQCQKENDLYVENLIS